MTYENDPNRRVGAEPYVERPVMQERDGMGWGIPLGIAAIVLIAGLLFFGTGSERTTTASNDRGTVTTTTPKTPAPTPPATAPTTAPTR
jgi:hypothetical protein